MHLPSAEKLWQIPAIFVFPIPFPLPLLSTPLLVQATSYFAASVKIRSFSITVSCPPLTARYSVFFPPDISPISVLIIHTKTQADSLKPPPFNHKHKRVKESHLPLSLAPVSFRPYIIEHMFYYVNIRLYKYCKFWYKVKCIFKFHFGPECKSKFYIGRNNSCTHIFHIVFVIAHSI